MSSLQKTIVYDWNGTLIDDAEIALDSFNYIMTHYGHPHITMEQYRAHYDMPIAKLYCGVGLSAEDFDAMQETLPTVFHDYYESKATDCPLRQGTAELLQKAHQNGISQVILSNHLVDPIREQTDRFDVTRFLDQIIADPNRAEQFKHGPKGEKLRRYLAANDLDPAQTIIVGDSPEEMLIAQDLGLISVAFTGGYVSKERLAAMRPHHLLDTPADLEAVLYERGFLL